MTPAERTALNSARYERIIASNDDEDTAAPTAALSAAAESPQPAAAAPGATRIKQFRVTHTSGLVTLVNTKVWMHSKGYFTGANLHAATIAGYRYPLDCTVRPVPDSEAIPLPWDLPLILRRPGQAGRPA